MFIIRSFYGIALLAASAGTLAQESSPDTNVVDLTIMRDGNVVATPKLTMRVGSTAVMTVAGAGGYSIKGSLKPDARIANGRKIDLEIHFAEDGRWELAAKPSISSELNRSSRMVLRDAGGKTLEIRTIISGRSSRNIGT